LVNYLVIWYIVNPFWYVLARKIWQPWRPPHVFRTFANCSSNYDRVNRRPSTVSHWRTKLADKTGGQNWRTKLADKTGGQNWRTKLADKTGGQNWRTKLADKIRSE
jgi:hypothetical protein